jgi:hypothetical protein
MRVRWRARTIVMVMVIKVIEGVEQDIKTITGW